jgi:hypothetical protein
MVCLSDGDQPQIARITRASHDACKSIRTWNLAIYIRSFIVRFPRIPRRKWPIERWSQELDDHCKAIEIKQSLLSFHITRKCCGKTSANTVIPNFGTLVVRAWDVQPNQSLRLPKNPTLNLETWNLPIDDTSNSDRDFQRVEIIFTVDAGSGEDPLQGYRTGFFGICLSESLTFCWPLNSRLTFDYYASW